MVNYDFTHIAVLEGCFDLNCLNHFSDRCTERLKNILSSPLYARILLWNNCTSVICTSNSNVEGVRWYRFYFDIDVLDLVVFDLYFSGRTHQVVVHTVLVQYIIGNGFSVEFKHHVLNRSGSLFGIVLHRRLKSTYRLFLYRNT